MFLAHLVAPEICLADIRRFLRRSGRIAIATPNADYLAALKATTTAPSSYVPDPTVCRHFTAAQVEALLSTTGFLYATPRLSIPSPALPPPDCPANVCSLWPSASNMMRSSLVLDWHGRAAMSDEVPFQVTSFAHVLAAHYSNPVVRVFSYQRSQKLTHQLRRLAAFFHPKTRVELAVWSGGDKLVVTPSIDCKQRQSTSSTRTPTCDHRNAAVLLCTPLLNQIRDAASFLNCVQEELKYSGLAILCARDRERIPRSSGPSEGTEWTPFELRSWLSRRGISVLFMGHTNATENDTSRSLIVAILAGRETPPVAPAPANFQVIAIMSSFNEADIIGPSLDYLLQQGIGPPARELVHGWYIPHRSCPRGTRCPHRTLPPGRSRRSLPHWLDPPAKGGTREGVGSRLVHPHRCGRDPGRALSRWRHSRGALSRRARRLQLRGQHAPGFSTDRRIIPSGGRLPVPLPILGAPRLGHFNARSGKRPRYPSISRTWAAMTFRSPDGGLYPFHFLLRHYPYRSSQQASRKLFEDRNLNPDEYRATGWGIHYSKHQRDPRRIRRPEDLRQFSSSFYDDYLIERLSAVGFRRPSNEGGMGKVNL